MKTLYKVLVAIVLITAIGFAQKKRVMSEEPTGDPVNPVIKDTIVVWPTPPIPTGPSTYIDLTKDDMAQEKEIFAKCDPTKAPAFGTGNLLPHEVDKKYKYIYVETDKRREKTLPTETLNLKTWDGGGDGQYWSSANNWNPDGVPTNTDSVVIDGNVTVRINTTETCGAVWVAVGSTLNLMSGGTLTVTQSGTGSGSMTVYGTANLYGTLNIAGDLVVGADANGLGVFNSYSSNIINFNGAGNQVISMKGTGSLYTVNFQGAGTTKSLDTALTIEGSLTINPNVTFSPGTNPVTIGGTLDNQGNYNGPNSLLTMNSSVAVNLYDSRGAGATPPATFNFGGLVISGGTKWLYDSITIHDSLVINSGPAFVLADRVDRGGKVHGQGASNRLVCYSALYIRRTAGTGNADQDMFPTGFEQVQMLNGTTLYDANSHQIIRTTEEDGDPLIYFGLYVGRQSGGINYRKTVLPYNTLQTQWTVTVGPRAFLDLRGDDIELRIGVNQNVGHTALNVQDSANAVGGAILFSTANGILRLVANAYQTIYITSRDTLVGGPTPRSVFNDIILEGSGGKDIVNTYGEYIRIMNDLRCSTGVAYLNMRNNEIRSITGGGSRTFELQDGVILYIRGTGTNGNFPDNFLTYILGPNSTVTYDAGWPNYPTQYIRGGLYYGNLIMGAPGNKQFLSSVPGIRGDFQINAGDTVYSGGFDLYVEGYWTNWSGTGVFIHQNNTVYFTGNQEQQIRTGGQGFGKTFYNFVVNKTGGTATLYGPLLVENNLTLQNGTFSTSTVNYGVRVNGNWERAPGATYEYNGSLTTLGGTGAQSIAGIGENDFYNLTLLNTGSPRTITVANTHRDSLHVTGNLIIQDNITLDASNDTLKVNGNFDNRYAGSFVHGTGKVVLVGGATQSIFSGYTGQGFPQTGKMFNHLEIRKDPATIAYINTTDLYVNGNFRISSGTTEALWNTGGYRDVFLLGDWINFGTFVPQTDTIHFIGANQTLSGSGANDFYNLRFAGSGTKTLTATIDVNRDVTIHTGVTLTMPTSENIYVGGHWINYGTFQASNGSTVIFTGTRNPQYIRSGGINNYFYNLEIQRVSNPQGIVRVANTDSTGALIAYDTSRANIRILNDLILTRGTLDLSQNASATAQLHSLFIGGSFIAEPDGYFLVRNNSALNFVKFESTGGGNKIIKMNEYIDVGQNLFHTLIFDAPGSVYTLKTNLRVFGNLILTNGTLKLYDSAAFSGRELFFGNSNNDSISITGGHLWVGKDSYLRLYTNTAADKSYLRVHNGGRLTLKGNAGDEAYITRQGTSGFYSFTVLTGGTIAARDAIFEFMDSIFVDGGTVDLTDNFSYCTFSNGNTAAGAVLLRIDNNQNLTGSNAISEINFPTKAVATSRNISKKIDAGNIVLVDPLGAFADSTGEIDPYNRIQWNFTTQITQWLYANVYPNNLWNLPANWSNGVPDNTKRAVIPRSATGTGRRPRIIVTNASAYRLTLRDTLYLGEGSTRAKLTVLTDLSADTVTAVLRSDPAGSGEDTIFIQGNLSVNGGRVTHNNKLTSIFSGASSQQILTDSLFNFVINKTGTATLGRNITIRGDVKILNGTLDANAYSMTVWGNWERWNDEDDSVGVFNPRTATVTMSGTGKTIRGTGSSDFYNLIIAGSDTLKGSINVRGTLTLNNGSYLDVSADNLGITLSGPNTAGTVFVNNGGTFVPRSGTVVFSGSTGDQTINPNGTVFNNMSFTGASNKFITSACVVTGNIDVNMSFAARGLYIETNGSIVGRGPNNTLSVGGSGYLVMRGADNFPDSMETVTFAPGVIVFYQSNYGHLALQKVTTYLRTGDQIIYPNLYLGGYVVQERKYIDSNLYVNGNLLVYDADTLRFYNTVGRHFNVRVNGEFNLTNGDSAGIDVGWEPTTITFGGNAWQPLYFNNDNMPRPVFHNMYFTGSGAKTMYYESPILRGNVTIDPGVPYLNLNGLTMTGVGPSNSFTVGENVYLYVRNTAVNDTDLFPVGFETITLATSSRVYYDQGNQRIRDTSANGTQIAYGGLYLGGNPSTKVLNGHTNVRGYLYLGPGVTLDVTTNNYDLRCGSTFENNQATSVFLARQGRVIMDGSSTQYIYTANVSKPFYKLIIRGSDVQLVQRIDVLDSLIIESGKLSMGGQTVYLSGNWVRDSNATVVPGTSTLRLTRNGSQTLFSPGADDFNNISIDSAGTKTFLTSMDINGSLTIGSDANLVVNTNLDTIYLAGAWTNNGSFTHNNAPVISDGTGGVTYQTNLSGLSAAATRGFYDLIIRKGTSTLTLGVLNSDLYVGRNLTIESGNLDVNINGTNTVYCYGNWINQNGGFLARTDTVYLRGSANHILRSGYNGVANYLFNHLVIDSPGTYTMNNYQIDVRGILRISRGTLKSNGYDIYFSTTGLDSINVDHGGTLEINNSSNLYVYQNCRVNVGNYGTAGTIKIYGDSTNTAQVTRRTGAGRFAFTVGPDGFISARHYRIEFTDANGLWLRNGAQIDTFPYNLSNGNFSNPAGVSGGAALRIDSLNNKMTLANGQGIWDVTFSLNPGGGARNVIYGDGTDTIMFVNSSGPFSGETYEQELSAGKIEWISTDSTSVWTGAVSNNWFNPANWNPQGVPDATRRVRIPSTAVNDCYADTVGQKQAVCKELTIDAGPRRLYIFNDTLTVHGNVNIYGRLTVSDQAGLIKVKGNWYNPGTFDHGGGKVRFDSTGLQSLVSGGITAAKHFGTLEVGSGSIVVATANAIEIKDSLIIENGGIFDNNNNQTIYVGKVWRNNYGGYYRPGASTVVFNGTTAQRIYGRDSADFYSVIFENAGQKTIYTNIDIRGNVTIRNSAVVNGNEQVIRLRGNWDNYTTFNAQRSVVIFEGGGQAIYGGGVSGTNVTKFASLWLKGTGTKTLFANIQIDSGLAYIDQTLNLQNYSIDGISQEDTFELAAGRVMYVRGANNFPIGFENIIIAPNSSVYYDVDTNQTIRTKNALDNLFQYGNLYMYNATNGNPSRKTLEGNLNTRGVLQIGVAARNEQTILDVGLLNYNINVGGNFFNYGLILSDTDAATNTITFDGNSGQQNIYPEGMHKGKSFYNLAVNNTSTAPNNNVVVQGIYDILVRNNLSISNGNFNANGRDVTVLANFTVTNGTYIPGGTTLYLKGTNKNWSSNNSQFNNVKITGSYTMLDNITVNGNFELLYGGLDVNGKQLSLNDAVTDNIIVDSNSVLDLKPGSQLRIFGGSGLTVKNGAEIKVIGADTNITLVTRNNATGYFGFTINPGAKISARYAKFEYINVSGVYVDQANVDLTNNFSYCTFDNGPADGIYLTFNNILNTDTIKIIGANFPYQPPGGSYNVRKNGSTPYVVFQDAAGAFEGEAFDYDLTNTIEWIYTTNNRVWTGAANTNWHNPQNWNPKSVPTRENNVIISTTASNLPVVTADTALAKTLRVSKGTLTLNGQNLVVDGNLTVDSTGTLTVQNATDTIFVAGNWTVTNTFNNGSGVVVFYGSAAQILSSGGTGAGKKFYNLVVNKTSGTTVTVGSSDIQVDRDLRILSGTLVQSSGRIITVNNEFFNSGTYTDNGGTLALASATAVNLTTNGANINNLTINKSGGSVTLQDNLTVNGNFTISAGSFYANGMAVNFGDAGTDAMSVSGNAYFNAGSSLRVFAGVVNGAQVTINNGGYIEFVGTPSQNVFVTRRPGGSQYYRFTVSSGGTIGAKHATFEFMNSDGLSITTNGFNSGISPTYDFDSTTFTNGISGGTFLKMNGTFVGGHITMLGVNFPSNPGGGAKNVERINATSGDTLIFYDASGAFEGVAYSSPPSSRVSWRYSTTNIYWDGEVDSLWSKAANWNPNTLPDDSSKNAIIPAGFYVVYDTTLTCNNVTINGGVVNIRANKKMNLTGSLNINSGQLRMNPYSTTSNQRDTIAVLKNITVSSGAKLVVKISADGASRSRIYVGENWTTAPGTYFRGTGYVEFNGDSTKTQIITTNSTPTDNLIFYMILNKNGHANAARLGSNLEVFQALELKRGTLDFNGYDVTVRYVYQNDQLGRIVPGTRKLTYIGTAAVNPGFLAGGTGTGKRFYNLEFAHTNPGVVTLSASGGSGVYVENNLTITSGSYLNSNGNHFYVNGNVDIARNPLAANDTLFLIGSNTVNLTITGDSLGHLVINKPSGIVNITQNNSVIRGRMNIRNGELNLSGFILNYGDASSDTILVDGGELHVDNNSTLRLISGSGINVRRGFLRLYSSNSAQPSNLRIRGTGSYAIQVNPAGQMDIGNGYLSDCNAFNVFGQLYFEPGTTSRFANGTIINMGNNGRFRAVGTDTSAANRVTIKPLTGNYRINFANGSRMIIHNVLVDSIGGAGQYGITLQSGSLIDSLNHVLFRRGTGLAYLSIATDQVTTANGLQFDSAGTNRMTYNISYTSGSGLLTVHNYKGNMSGVFFEQDNGTPPFGRVTYSLNETQTIPAATTVAFGHRDFTVSGASANLGSTNLQMISDTLDLAQFSVTRFFTIQPTNAGSATIRMWYPKQEENDQYLANLHIWRRRSGQWMMVDTMAGVTITRDSSVVINGQRIFSIQASGYNFAAGIRDTIVMSTATNEASLPVVLAYFRGQFNEGKVVLEWKTESEMANAYWLIQRKEISDDEMNKISAGQLTLQQTSGEFITLNQIKGAGSKTSETLYEYIDANVPAGKRYAYRIADVSYNGVITFHDPILINAELPREFGLSQNYPNPFNPSTTIRYQLPVDAKVTIKIYNVLGQEVYSLVNKNMQAGYHQILWNGINSRNSTVASGVYIYRITAQSVDGKQKFTKTRKMMFLK